MNTTFHIRNKTKTTAVEGKTDSRDVVLKESNPPAAEEIQEIPAPPLPRTSSWEVAETPSRSIAEVDELVEDPIQESEEELAGPAPPAQQDTTTSTWKLLQWYLRTL